MTTPAFDPQPCGSGSGAGGKDLENLILCDTLPDGTVVGTALAVYDYTDGSPNAAPTFVNPATGVAYTPQGVLQPCPGEAGCLEPVQFHRTTTATGPVDHPGRQYDITLPINPGFAVQSMQVDSVTNAANVVWDVADPDGEQFRQDLTTFMEGRLPAAAVVTITNPNAGNTICGTAAPMQIHIECLRLDQSPPDLIELVYNGGQDMIINPAYNETPPLNPPVAQGNYGYHLLARQDDPGPFPGNPPAGRVNCTNTVNRGWETNDFGKTFEIWGHDVAGGVTPTPRGTPVQEITSDGPPAGQRSTVWQTFQAPASGNFIIRVVHGARDAGEIHRITLDNGDTDAAQNGDLINDVTTPAVVYGNPWTTFTQTIPLVSGSVYTLALSTTENPPDGNARGGLFTDMRAYIDRPDQRATAATNDDTCVVTVQETTTQCQEELWSPICAGGNIDGWQNAQTGAVLSNSAFWGQAPAPIPGACPASASSGGSGNVNANLVHTYTVCAVVGGVQTNLQRVVITDASGGVLADSFIGPDGGPVTTPSAYTIGSCTDTAFVNDVVLCDVTPTGTVSFLRKFVQTIDATNQGRVVSHADFSLDGTSTYTVAGIVSDCTDAAADRETVCWTDSNGAPGVHTGTIRHQDGINPQGWLLFDQNQNLVLDTSGVTFVPCGADAFSTTGLCLPDGTPLAVVTAPTANGTSYTDVGWINLRTGAFTAGNPPVAAIACGASSSVQVSGTFCSVRDSDGAVLALILLEYHYNPDGTIASVRLVNATDGATYTVPAGATITTCPDATPAPDRDITILCDDNGSFVRDYTRDSAGAIVGFTDRTLAGAPYAPVGTVRNCTGRDSESVILCDANGTRFLRTYIYSQTTGAVSGTFDTNLTGTPFAPVGVVGVCTTQVATDFDFTEEVLCDANGTSFIRRFTFNSTTGAVTATTNLTLAGAAFTPVGTVGVCANCCPVVVAEGCTNTGSGRYVATRAANGTITLQDAVTGAAITQAQIVQCVQQVAPTSVTLTAQHQLLSAGQTWTPPGGVTLTSVTYTVLSGTATVVDQSGDSAAGLPAGLSATWNAEDHSALTPPQSVAAVGGQTYVNWTQR